MRFYGTLCADDEQRSAAINLSCSLVASDEPFIMLPSRTQRGICMKVPFCVMISISLCHITQMRKLRIKLLGEEQVELLSDVYSKCHLIFVMPLSCFYAGTLNAVLSGGKFKFCHLYLTALNPFLWFYPQKKRNYHLDQQI